MIMRWTMIGAAMALWGSSPVAAQPVFFDDFDGPDLLPHWDMFPPPRWDHEVSGGMLHVKDLFFPSVPKLEANFALIGAFFEPQVDFRMDVWMGWEREPAPQFDELVVGVVGPAGGIMAEFGLRYPGGPPAVIASAGAEEVSVPPPPPGIYQFTIARTGAIFDFYLDGEHFGSLPDPGEVTPVGGVHFFFSKPFPGDMNPYHVDRVRVIPAPGALIVSSLCLLAWARRRR